MELFPLIYLKNGKAHLPVGTKASWFREEASDLALNLESQGAPGLYLSDLNVPLAGKGENSAAILSIQKKTKLKLWVSGQFRSTAAMEAYMDMGVEKLVLGGEAYQNPQLVKEAAQKFGPKIAVLIEVKNNRVVVPGLVTPSHKTALDYAKRFEDDGASALCFSDSNAQGILAEENIKGIRDFCAQVQVPVLALSDIQKMQDLEKLFESDKAGLKGVVLGKSLYSGAVDLRSSLAFLNDLAITFAQEETEVPDE